MNLFIKSIFRNLWKRKSFTILNITGLAIGIATSGLIFLWVESEATFDHHFGNRENIYRVMELQNVNDETFTVRVTPGQLAGALKAEIPGIKNSTRTSGGSGQALFALNDKVFYQQGEYVDSSFFSVFKLDFVHGNATHAFDQVHSLVITESMARVFFGDVAAVGQTLKMDNDQLFTITGVIRDMPENSSFNFKWLAPFDLILEKFTWLSAWEANGIATFVELNDGADVGKINAQLENFLKTKKSTIDTRCFLFAMPDWHLYNHFTNGVIDGQGQIKYVKLFTLIAVLILVIACINFMNLATSRSEERAREVGVRKTLGAGRAKLVAQFIGESMVMSAMSVALAVSIIYFTLPGFNLMVEKNLVMDLSNPLHIGTLLAIGILTGFFAGSYPAFYLSSFHPVQVLKGLTAGTGGAAFVRKGLVTVQFVVSITLIICTVVIYQQVQYSRDRDLGYYRKDILYMAARGKTQDQFTALKTSLMNTGVVEDATLSMNPTFRLGWYNGSNYSWQSKDPNKDVLVTVEAVTPEYISTMGLKLKAGRDFNSIAANDVDNVIINESLARKMGVGNQVGNIITQNNIANPAKDWKMRIIGIVEDFVYGDMYSLEAAPMIMTCNPVKYNFLTLRLKEDADLSDAVNKIQSVMKSANPEYPFEYAFLDEEFDKLFKTEMLIEKLSGVFATLAIFISCLGLFGLAAYTASRRTKEISIRKILGASVVRLASLLSRDFLRLVIVASVISFPLAWWLMTDWLESYAYRTPIHWWVFVFAGLGALVIAIATVSFQTIKAAFVNPANSLRRE